MEEEEQDYDRRRYPTRGLVSIASVVGVPEEEAHPSEEDGKQQVGQEVDEHFSEMQI